MAEDKPSTVTPVKEDLSREALNVRPENKPFEGKQWSDTNAQILKPPENANMMAGGTQHTAGGKLPEVTLGNAVGTIRAEEFKDLYKKPCVRDSWMTGIGTGFGAMALKGILGGSVWASCNYAVVTFIVGAVGQYQYCQYRRRAEKAGMMRAVEVLNRKEVEKRAREARKEQLRAERRKAKDDEQDAQLAALKSAQTRPSWKFW